MGLKLPRISIRTGTDGGRRRLLGALLAGSGLAALSGRKANAQAEESLDDMRFPGDPPDHKLVYQFNKGDQDYHQHVLFSVGAVLRTYSDAAHLVVTCFGPGIHILAKKPGREVSEETAMRVSSLAQYGVEFHACNNTLKSLGWTEEDLLPFATVVDSGAVDLMLLQEEGYSYISW